MEADGWTRLSLDEKVFKMFGKDSQTPLSDREAKARQVLFDEALDLLQHNQKLILDWGFWKQVDRSEVKKLFMDKGYAAEIWYFTTDFETLVNRVENRGKGSNHIINPAMMEGFVAKYEAPGSPDKIIKT